MASYALQTLDNYSVPDDRTSHGQNEQVLRILYESTRYRTSNNYHFTPQSSCLGRLNHPDFDEFQGWKDNIKESIRKTKALRNMVVSGQIEEIQLLKGMNFELLTVNNCAVVLGEGTFGVVYLAKDIHTNKLVAIKIFKLINGLKLSDILKEVGFQMVTDKQSTLSFTPKIMGLLFFLKSRVPKNCHQCMVAMEYLAVLPKMGKPMKLSLDDAVQLRLKGKDVLQPIQWESVCKQLIDITMQLSQIKISHLDLHDSNILFILEQDRILVNIIDYGKCVWMEKTTRLTGFNANSCLFGKELAELQHPLPTSDLYIVSAAILQICKMHKWKASADVIKQFRKQAYNNRWHHTELAAKLFIKQH